MKKYDATVAGYTCADMIPEFRKDLSVTDISAFFKPGKLIEINGMNFVPGGVVPNTGLAMKKFGMNVFLNGLTGEDQVGKMIKDCLDHYDLSEGLETTHEAGTAFSIVIAPHGIDRIFLESPGCNEIFDSRFINFEAISQSRLFHFGYPPLMKQFYKDNGNLLSQLFSKVQQMGVVTSLDFSLPDPESDSGKADWPQIMKHVLLHTDIFVPSLEELISIIRPPEHIVSKNFAENFDIMDQVSTNIIREIGRQVIGMGVKILLIKAGKNGACLFTGDVTFLNLNSGLNLASDKWNNIEMLCRAYPADPVKILNSSGAGDTAVAAFLTAILMGEDPGKAIKYAALAGRNNLYCNNIYKDLDSWEEMTMEMNSAENNLICY